jgi:hypothetical protein
VISVTPSSRNGELTPDVVQRALSLDPEKFARVQRDVEERLLRANTKAHQRARREVEESIGSDGTS